MTPKLWTRALIGFALLGLMSCGNKIKNAQTETVKVYGNCGMCEKTIENAANKEGEVEADWNKDTKMLSVTYDQKNTSLDEILQRIANAGYDSDKFRASDKAYEKLHSCCQYERPVK